MTETVQGSKVLSPATFRILPLKGTSTFATLEAGSVADLPASNVGDIPVNFRGRILHVAGDRTFDPWTVTVINDEDFRVRTAFERWANVMSKLDDATGVTNPSSYMTDAEVQQLGRGASLNATVNEGGESIVLRTYKFYDIFPTAISEIALSYDTGDTVETFDVTFQVQYFTIGASSGDTTAQATVD